MSYQRVVAILSAVLASIVVFYVATSWRLVGTLAGAALIPLVHSLVSHWSHRGLDRSIAVVRRRAVGRPEPSEDTQGVPDGSALSPPLRSTESRLSWLLVGLTCIAVALGIYAVAFRTPADRVVVHERVVERQVTVTAQPATLEGRDASPPVTATTTSDTTSSDTAASTTTLPADSGETSTTTSPGPASGPRDTTGTSVGRDSGDAPIPEAVITPDSTADPGSVDSSMAPSAGIAR
jgi:hypothetical protein